MCMYVCVYVYACVCAFDLSYNLVFLLEFAKNSLNMVGCACYCTTTASVMSIVMSRHLLVVFDSVT